MSLSRLPETCHNLCRFWPHPGHCRRADGACAGAFGAQSTCAPGRKEEGAETDPDTQVEAPSPQEGFPEMEPCCSGSLLQSIPGSDERAPLSTASGVEAPLGLPHEKTKRTEKSARERGG